MVLEMVDNDRFPVAPAVVIGLGGSGDWVLRELKGRLRRGSGSVPPSVRLVGIDAAVLGGPSWRGAADDYGEEQPPSLDQIGRAHV